MVVSAPAIEKPTTAEELARRLHQAAESGRQGQDCAGERQLKPHEVDRDQ